MTIKERVKTEVEKLPENLLAQVLDFIEFLESKKGQRSVAKECQELSSASFQKIWDNDEDAVYDNV